MERYTRFVAEAGVGCSKRDRRFEPSSDEDGSNVYLARPPRRMGERAAAPYRIAAIPSARLLADGADDVAQAAA